MMRSGQETGVKKYPTAVAPQSVTAITALRIHFEVNAATS